MASSNLAPAREKLQKLWRPGSSSSAAPEHRFKDWSNSDLSTVIRLAGFQMGALGNPANRMSADIDALRGNDRVPRDDLEMAAGIMAVHPVRPPPPVPMPSRAPPPPPVSQPLHLALGQHASVESISKLRRRAKTPVHEIGQLETAARLKHGTGVGRMSSVSTIARQYRQLVVDDLEAPLLGSEHDRPATTSHDIPNETLRESPLLESPRPRRRSQVAPSPASDDGTLVAFEDEDAIHGKPPGCEKVEVVAPLVDPAALRLQIGLDLLTRELLSVCDASGLQVWVMIEAYERLRDRIAAGGADFKEAGDAIDTWLEALYAIHKSVTDEAALSESEYGD